MRYVVGVAGPAGGGKSTLVRALAAQLDDSVAIHIDSYQKITEEPIRKLVDWMERGADFGELVIPLLAQHLQSLKQGEPVVDPSTGREIAPRKHLLFETHFGRAHHDSGRYIDLLIWLETPLDVALARNVQDFLRPLIAARADPAMGERLGGIHRYLETYVADVRRLRMMQRERVRADADVVIDGGGDLEDIVRRARREILERLP